jgi:hypothetical protein
MLPDEQSLRWSLKRIIRDVAATYTTRDLSTHGDRVAEAMRTLIKDGLSTAQLEALAYLVDPERHRHEKPLW